MFTAAGNDRIIRNLYPAISVTVYSLILGSYFGAAFDIQIGCITGCTFNNNTVTVSAAGSVIINLTAVYRQRTGIHLNNAFFNTKLGAHIT